MQFVCEAGTKLTLEGQPGFVRNMLGGTVSDFGNALASLL